MPDQKVSPEALLPLAPPQKRRWEAPILEEIDYDETTAAPAPIGPPDGMFYS